MAKECGLSQSAISRIWQAFALQPHRTETFKLSKDPLFIEKVRDIVGLVSESARSGFGVVRGREVPDSGPRPNSAAFAHEAGPARASHP